MAVIFGVEEGSGVAVIGGSEGAGRMYWIWVTL